MKTIFILIRANTASLISASEMGREIRILSILLLFCELSVINFSYLSFQSYVHRIMALYPQYSGATLVKYMKFRILFTLA